MEPRLSDLTERMRRLEAFGDFPKLAWCYLRYPSNPNEAAALAEREFKGRSIATAIKSAIPAADAVTPGWASELSNYRALQAEWISLLSSRTIAGRLNFRRAALNTKWLVEGTPGTATWCGPGESIPASRMLLANVTLDSARISGICFFTEESIESWRAETASMINNAMLNVIGRYSDLALVDPTIAAVSGKNPASLTSGITPAVSAGTSAANATTDLKALLQAHVNAGSDLNDVSIVMAPSSSLYLSTLLNAGNQRAFPGLGPRGGTVFDNIPVITSLGCRLPGSPSTNAIVAIDAQKVLYADPGVIQLAAARATSVQMDDAPGSGPQTTISFIKPPASAFASVAS